MSEAKSTREIQHTEDENGGEFFVERKGERVAEMTYSREGGAHITIRHTEVDTELEGEGLGTRLVTAAVEWARREGVKVGATCSFARAVLAKTPAFADVRG